MVCTDDLGLEHQSHYRCEIFVNRFFMACTDDLGL